MTEASKSLGNTDSNEVKKNVSDLVVWGDGDTFKLICKASSVEENWMKSTKAMEVPYLGCVIQVTTQQGDNVAEALQYVPGVKIQETKDDEGNVVSRAIVPLEAKDIMERVKAVQAEAAAAGMPIGPGDVPGA